MVSLGHNTLLAIGDGNCIIYINNASKEMYVTTDVITHWKYIYIYIWYWISLFWILPNTISSNLNEQQTLSGRTVHLMYWGSFDLWTKPKNISTWSNTFVMLMIWYGMINRKCLRQIGNLYGKLITNVGFTKFPTIFFTIYCRIFCLSYTFLQGKVCLSHRVRSTQRSILVCHVCCL